MEDGAMMIDLQTSMAEIESKQELESFQSQVDALREKLQDLKIDIQWSENVTKMELELFWCKVGSISTILTYLKSKARNMAVMHLAHCTKHDELKFISEHSTVSTDCSKDANTCGLGGSAEAALLSSDTNLGMLAASSCSYIGKLLKSFCTFTDIMESLIKRVVIAEAKVDCEKEKVNLGLIEIRRKALQIEKMSAKVKEIETFAASTIDKLNEMRQEVERMVHETYIQKQHAAENELELSRVKQDFQLLKSSVNDLIRSREEAALLESQLQKREIVDRLAEKNSRLEHEKVQKEAEVQKMMEENVKLRNLLDKKEAQLLAMNEQCKFMALNKS